MLYFCFKLLKMEQDILLKEKIDKLLPILDEHQKRLYLATEAKYIGRGGLTKISKLTGVSRVTINSGLLDLETILEDNAKKTSSKRIRREGGGRKKKSDLDGNIKKIILEIVPWISNKEARGWNESNKKIAIEEISKVEMDAALQRNKLFLLSILEKIEANYTFSEFSDLQKVQQSKIVSDLSMQIFKEANSNSKLFNQIRADAIQLFKLRKIDQAINLIENTIVNYNVPKASDYNILGYFYMFSNQNLKALQYLQKAEKLDVANIGIQLNLAHVYLLSDQNSKAKTIYKKHKNQNIDAKTSFKAKAIQDFTDLEKVGIFSDDFKKIIDKLNDK